MTDNSTPANPILKTIEKMRAGLTEFFWDAFIALQVNDISGDYVEFGSWGGNTIHGAYKTVREMGQPRHLWAYCSPSRDEAVLSRS